MEQRVQRILETKRIKKNQGTEPKTKRERKKN